VSGVAVKMGFNVGVEVGAVAVTPFGVGVGIVEVELEHDMNSIRQKSRALEIALTRLTNIEYPS